MFLRNAAASAAWCFMALTTTPATASGNKSVPDLYADTTSIMMTASHIDREAVESYAVRDDGAFAMKLYARVFFDQLAEELTPEQTWDNTAVHYVYFDGKKTLYSAYSPMPLSMYEKTLAEQDVPLGDSIHLRPCLWPLLDSLIQMGVWEPSPTDQQTLFIEHLALRIVFDRHGRVLTAQHETKELSQTWSYHGYNKTGEGLFPTKMTRSLHVVDRKGKVLLDEISSFKLRITENPENIAELVSVDGIVKQSNRRDQYTMDVFSPKGELLYNQKDVEDQYLRAVGIRNPIRTRNILFISIGVLAVGSLIVWKRRAA